MSQHDFDITAADANTGATMRAAINAAFQALAGNSSGATEPTTKYPYQLWADTTNGYLKIRNAANSAWITGPKLSDLSYDILPVNSGVKFPATQSASSDPNTLDDYEEGTWTPVLKFGGTTSNATYTHDCTYTKVGDLVTIRGKITLSAKGSTTGAYTTITGFGFTGAGGATVAHVGNIQCTGLTGATNLVPTVAVTTTAVYVSLVSNGNVVDMSDAYFTNTTTLHFTITFKV